MDHCFQAGAYFACLIKMILLKINPGVPNFKPKVCNFRRQEEHDLEQELASCGLLAKSGPPPVFINKILLNIHAYLFAYGVQLLSDETVWPTKLKALIICPLTENACVSSYLDKWLCVHPYFYTHYS